MAIHNDDEGPIEVSTVLKSENDENSHFCSSETNKIIKKGSKLTSWKKMTEETNVVLKQKHKKLKNKSKKSNSSGASAATDCEYNNFSTTEVSEEDLLQLRTVYKQCKSVLRKMELKYGDLLDASTSDSTDGPSNKRYRLDNAQEEENECHCILNKKIVFDEEGKEVSIDSLPSNHICPTKLMSKNEIHVMNVKNNIEIEYYNKSTELTDNLQELRRILQDPSIETTYRNQVVEKLKLIKQEHLNEIKFKKQSLIEKLKTNPEEVFSFNGSNLSVITGYS